MGYSRYSAPGPESPPGSQGWLYLPDGTCPNRPRTPLSENFHCIGAVSLFDWQDAHSQRDGVPRRELEKHVDMVLFQHQFLNPE